MVRNPRRTPKHCWASQIRVRSDGRPITPGVSCRSVAGRREQHPHGPGPAAAPRRERRHQRGRPPLVPVGRPRCRTSSLRNSCRCRRAAVGSPAHREGLPRDRRRQRYRPRVCERLAREGASIVVLDTWRTPREGGPTVLEACAAARQEQGLPAVDDGLVEGSVADASASTAAVAEALARFGRLDVLVNNAALLDSSPLLETTEDEWDLFMNVNAKGTFLCTKAAVAQYMQQVSTTTHTLLQLQGSAGMLIERILAITTGAAWGRWDPRPRREQNPSILNTESINFSAKCIVLNAMAWDAIYNPGSLVYFLRA